MNACTQNPLDTIQLDRNLSIPAYRQLQTCLADMIVTQSLKAGDRLPSGPDLVRHLNINYQTVRQAYQGLAQRGLVEIINGKGTFVAEPKSSTEDNTNKIVIFGEHQMDMNQPDNEGYIISVCRGIRLEAEKKGFDCSYLQIQSDPVEDLWAMGTRNCIVVSTANSSSCLKRFQQANINVVTVSVKAPEFPSVHSNEEQGLELLIDHLTGLGHKRIAFVSGPLNNFTTQRRQQAYWHNMAKHNLDIHPSWICPMKLDELSTPESQEALYRQLFESSKPPTAVIAVGYRALIMIQTLHRHGLSVPKDVTVVGHDDPTSFAYSTPALTTVRQDFEGIGRVAVQNLFEVASGKHVEEVALPVELIIRDSCGTPAV